MGDDDDVPVPAPSIPIHNPEEIIMEEDLGRSEQPETTVNTAPPEGLPMNGDQTGEEIPISEEPVLPTSDQSLDQSTSSGLVSFDTTKFLALDKCVPNRAFLDVGHFIIGVLRN